jgi:hypothetical protein
MTEDEKGYSPKAMLAEGYNGWKNYETWAVKLWMDNDEGTQGLYADMARRHGENVHSLALAVKDEVLDLAPDLGASMYADLLGSALDSVDWREIAESLIEDLD